MYPTRKSSSTPTITLPGALTSHGPSPWFDYPIILAAQVRCCRLNKLVPEFNFLLDPNLPICRSWRVSVSTQPSTFDLQKYGKSKGKDNGSHLSDQRSAAFLMSIYSGWGQGLRDRNSIHDFGQCRPAISVPAYTQTSYFNEVQDLKQRVYDTTSVAALMALNVMEAYVIDVSSLSSSTRRGRSP